MKKLSKVLLIAAVVTCVTCLLCVSAFAATSIGVSADKTVANPGDTVTITVTVPQNDGFGVLPFSVSFDPDVFDYVTHGLTSTFPAEKAQPGYDAGHSVGFVLGNNLGTNVGATGTAATVTLKVKETAATGTSSTISVVPGSAIDADLHSITVTPGSCAVNIQAPATPSPTPTAEPTPTPTNAPTPTPTSAATPTPTSAATPTPTSGAATPTPTNASTPTPTNAPKTTIPPKTTTSPAPVSGNNNKGAKDNVLKTGEADYLPIIVVVGLIAVVGAVILLRKKNASRT